MKDKSRHWNTISLNRILKIKQCNFSSYRNIAEDYNWNTNDLEYMILFLNIKLKEIHNYILCSCYNIFLNTVMFMISDSDVIQ